MGSCHTILKRGYSPEQIAGTLAIVHSETSSLQVSYEAIYTAIYAMPRGELRGQVIGWLHFGHAKRRPCARCEDRRGWIPDRVGIHDRPPEVATRLAPGHWKGDLIRRVQTARRSVRWWSALPCSRCWESMDNASARAALSGFSHVLNRIEAQKRLSLTYDQGREMTAHQWLTEATGVKVYFADPHSPGRGESTRTSTACCGSICPRAAI